jgi:hypothetical protein
MDVFLQFLYDLNVICYRERLQDGRPYYRWCFRERSYGNISPKVKAEVQYQVFYGLARALNVGRQSKSVVGSCGGLTSCTDRTRITRNPEPIIDA